MATSLACYKAWQLLSRAQRAGLIEGWVVQDCYVYMTGGEQLKGKGLVCWTSGAE